jgi:hypothetical protein
MSELKDKGYNEKRYLPDTKIIQIDPLGAALDKAGHEGGAGKSLRKKSNEYKLRRVKKIIQKTPNKEFKSTNNPKSSGAKNKKLAKQQMQTIKNKADQTKDTFDSPIKLARGGRAGYKDGSKGCKLAMKGKGKAYGKNS